VRAAHAQLRARSRLFYLAEKDRLSPFVPLDRFTKLTEMKLGGAEGVKEKEVKATRIGPKESYIHAELREYQVDGVNWILGQYERGVGGILADEMGLGKTIQTLGFLATLKANGYPGPHLVVTPLAVLQNWQNEIKRFTPGLSSIKVHGSAKERDRILEMPEVLRGDYDVYLTTYEMIMTEEAFFTETFLVNLFMYLFSSKVTSHIFPRSSTPSQLMRATGSKTMLPNWAHPSRAFPRPFACSSPAHLCRTISTSCGL